MFGFTGADSAETVVRKRAYMAEAQARWPFLTHFDASTIKTQVLTLVKERGCHSQEDAEADVRNWTRILERHHADHFIASPKELT